MKRFQGWISGVLLTSLLGLAPGAWAAMLPVLTVEPSASSVAPGEVFGLTIYIAGVSDLYGFQFDVTYDPSVLAALNVQEGPFLPSGGTTIFLTGTIDHAAGSITNTADVLSGAMPGVSGSGTLATLDFQALALGTSAISLSNVLLLDSALAEIAFETGAASASVVPEPGTLALLGSGLLGAVALRRSRRSRVPPA